MNKSPASLWEAAVVEEDIAVRGNCLRVKFTRLLYVLLWSGMVVMMTQAGCTSTPPVVARPQPAIAPTSEKLRQYWVRELAFKVSPFVGRDYDSYILTERNGERGKAFYKLVGRMARSPAVSGPQCLDLLGPPDHWKLAADGTVLLIYFYADDGAKQASFIHIDSQGKVFGFGWNVASANKYDDCDK